MAGGYGTSIMQDYAYVTRVVNGTEITWLVKVKFYANYETALHRDVECYVSVRELGTNYSLSHNAVGDWTGTIIDRTPEATKGIFIDGSYDGIHMFSLTNENGTIELTASNTYDDITNEYNTVLFSDLTYDMSGEWILNGSYALFEFTLNCPKNSIFDGYGTYSTNFLDGAYIVKEIDGQYYKSYVANEDFGLSLSGAYAYSDGCAWGQNLTPSEIVAANGNIGSDIAVHIESDSGVGTIPLFHNVYYSYDNSTWVNIPLSHYSIRDFTWNIPMEFYKEIPNDRMGDIYFKVETMGFDEDGEDTVVHSQTTTITAYTVEAECIPDLSPTIYDSNSVTVALTGNKNNLIRHKSHATFNANAVVKHYATIASI